MQSVSALPHHAAPSHSSHQLHCIVHQGTCPEGAAKGATPHPGQESWHNKHLCVIKCAVHHATHHPKGSHRRPPNRNSRFRTTQQLLLCKAAGQHGSAGISRPHHHQRRPTEELVPKTPAGHVFTWRAGSRDAVIAGSVSGATLRCHGHFTRALLQASAVASVGGVHRNRGAGVIDIHSATREPHVGLLQATAASSAGSSTRVGDLGIVGTRAPEGVAGMAPINNQDYSRRVG